MRSKAPVIGRYERDEARPSIETAARLAQELDVSLDYLAGHTQMELDRDTLRRIEVISGMSDEEQSKIFMVIDALIRDFKLREVAQA